MIRSRFVKTRASREADSSVNAVEPSTAAVDVRDLVMHYPTRTRGVYVHAVNEVSFRIDQGETLALVGESGSGKSTIGRCVLRLIEATGGDIVLFDVNLRRLVPRDVLAFRRRAQLVFQEPRESLDPRFRVHEMIREPLDIHRLGTREERNARILELMKLVGLPLHLENRFRHQLSNGQQQRVGIARSLALDPSLLVLDEPTSALDPVAKVEIATLLGDLQQRLGLTYLLISHDMALVRHLSRRVAVMYLGRIVEVGSVAQIFEGPRHPYTKALIASVLAPDPVISRSTYVLRGEIPSSIDLPVGCSFHSRCPIGLASCLQSFPPLEQVDEGHFVACYRWREPEASPSYESSHAHALLRRTGRRVHDENLDQGPAHPNDTAPDRSHANDAQSRPGASGTTWRKK